MKIKQHWKHYILLFLGIFLMAIFFPLSGDDWNRMAQLDRSLSWYISAVNDQWHNLNGRVLGNLISFVFIKPAPVRALIKALAWALLVKIILQIIDRDQPVWIWLTSGLLFLIPIEVFRQVWVWSAGFFNYVPPMICLFAYYWKGLATIQNGDKVSPSLLLWFLFALQAGLYMENLTAFFVVLTAFLTTYYAIVHKQLSLTMVVLFLGAALGFIIMFKSPVYGRVMVGEDDYRSVGRGLASVLETIQGNWPQFSLYMLRRNPLHIMLFSILFGLSFMDTQGQQGMMRKLIYGVFVILGMGFVFSEPLTRDFVTPLTFGIDLLLHVLYYLMLLYLGLGIFKRAQDKRIWTFSILSLPIAMGPLFFVTPVVARNFIMPAFLHVFWIVMLASQLSKKQGINMNALVVRRLAYTLFASIYTVYMVIYVANGLSFFERNRIMQEAVDYNLDHTTISRYPFEWAVAIDDPGKISKYYYREEPYDIEVTYEEDWETID